MDSGMEEKVLKVGARIIALALAVWHNRGFAQGIYPVEAGVIVTRAEKFEKYINGPKGD